MQKSSPNLILFVVGLEMGHYGLHYIYGRKDVERAAGRRGLAADLRTANEISNSEKFRYKNWTRLAPAEKMVFLDRVIRQQQTL